MNRTSLIIAMVAPAGLGCTMQQTEIGQYASDVINGSDDRIEVFDVESPAVRALVADSMVAVIPRASIARAGNAWTINAPTWRDVDNLCPGEPFADQPAAAFCSGVLVDWDLVLTAGHCARVLPLEDIAIVFGYYYASPGGMTVDEVRYAREIVTEALDPEGGEPRRDFAWLRLDRSVSPSKRPLPLYTHSSSLAQGEPVISIGTGGGVPMKVDDGGTVRDLREEKADYFVADTDTSFGSSGGAALDGRLALTGILARGGPDIEMTADGCWRMIRQPAGAAAQEQFSYTQRAVEGLCARGESVSSLCRAGCEDPCGAAPLENVAGAGCAIAVGVPRSGIHVFWLFLVASGLCRFVCRPKVRLRISNDVP